MGKKRKPPKFHERQCPLDICVHHCPIHCPHQCPDGCPFIYPSPSVRKVRKGAAEAWAMYEWLSGDS